MCGRYTQTKEQFEFASRFGQIIHKGKPRWNVAPTQTMPVIVLRDGKAACELMHWGWRPSWMAGSLINAQGESIDTKPTFKKAFAAGQRCLVPADGFYEWKTEPTGKQPMRFTFGSGAPIFFFAGLFNSFPKEDQKEDCFLLLTTRADAVVSPVHHRMPVMLRKPEELDAWLSADPAPKELATHQEPGLSVYPVSKMVSNARNDKPECIEEELGGDLEAICRKCGIRKGDHLAVTLNCPEGRKTGRGYLHHYSNSFFTPPDGLL